MRFRYYFVVADLAGNTIEDAAVSVYLAGTNNPATIYLTRTSEEGNNTPPQIYSDITGKVEFWVDSDDYDYGQLFKIVVVKDDWAFQVDDVQIIVWDAVRAVRALEAEEAVNSDKLDGYHASQDPAANMIPVARSDGKLDIEWVPKAWVNLEEAIAISFFFGR